MQNHSAPVRTDDFANTNKGLDLDREDPKADVNKAFEKFTKLVKRSGIAAYLDSFGRCFVRSEGSGVSSEEFLQTRPLSPEEVAQREKLVRFLDDASEDDVIEKIQVPLSSVSDLALRGTVLLAHR